MYQARTIEPNITLLGFRGVPGAQRAGGLI